MYLNSSKVYLKLRNHMIKFRNADIDLLQFQFRQIFAESKFISQFKYISEFKV